MNSWALWILGSAVFLAFYDLAKKASVRGNAVLPVLLVSTICGSLAFSLSLVIGGGIGGALHPTARILIFAAIKSLIVATSWIFTFCALRTLPITIATPIRSSSPVLVFLIANVLYGEMPTLVQAIGMLAVFGGYWTFSWAGRNEGIDFFHDKAVYCAIAGAVLAAVSAIWDKYVFQVAGLPVGSVQFYYQIGLVAVYAVGLLIQRTVSRAHDRFEWRWTIPFVGILLAAADWLYFTGIAADGMPISVASLMRRFSVVITFVLGAVIFRERNLRRKALALLLILIGILLLAKY